LSAKEVAKQGEHFRGWRVKSGSYLPIFLIFTLLLIIISRGYGLRGSLLPPMPSQPLGLLPFVVGMVGFHLATSSSRVTPPWCTVHIPMILHKNAYMLKWQKLT
jgi:hypothetical protein